MGAWSFLELHYQRPPIPVSIPSDPDNNGGVAQGSKTARGNRNDILMRPGMNTKRPRNNRNNQRRGSGQGGGGGRSNSFDSNGPDVKIRGNPRRALLSRLQRDQCPAATAAATPAEPASAPGWPGRAKSARQRCRRRCRGSTSGSRGGEERTRRRCAERSGQRAPARHRIARRVSRLYRYKRFITGGATLRTAIAAPIYSLVSSPVAHSRAETAAKPLNQRVPRQS